MSESKKKVTIGYKKLKNVDTFDQFDIHKEELQGGVNEKELNENAVAMEMDEIFNTLGYRQGFDEFIEDNPGAVDVFLEWLANVPEFATKLKGLDIMSGYLDESKKTA